MPTPTADRSLIRPLPEGPLDLVGDIHGEVIAMTTLLGKLGYDDSGRHPDGRHMVFLGDLVDRGPDSPAVVHHVMRMVANGNASALLGNHELNTLLGREKKDNAWFFHHAEQPDQRPIDPADRSAMLAFFAELPLGLERGDVRAVHAAWDEAMIARARTAGDTAALFKEAQAEIERHVLGQPHLDPHDRKLAHQNHNPVKLLTSGPEVRSAAPWELDGQARMQDRVPWWLGYDDGPLVVFGHYSRKPLEDDDTFKMASNQMIFGVGARLDTLNGPNAVCIDYSVGARGSERRAGRAAPFLGELAALRWPERELVFDQRDIPVPLQGRPDPAGLAAHEGGVVA